MLTHQAYLLADHALAAGYHAASIGSAFKTAGKAILIFLVLIFAAGAVLGLLIGFFVGRSVGRKQSSPEGAGVVQE